VTQEEVETVTWGYGGGRLARQQRRIFPGNRIATSNRVDHGESSGEQGCGAESDLGQASGAARVVEAYARISDVGSRLGAFSPYTALYNVTGQPSMSVPLSWSGEGLPIGVMFSGRFGEDALLFRLGPQLEKAQPWKDRKPKI